MLTKILLVAWLNETLLVARLNPALCGTSCTQPAPQVNMSAALQAL